MCAQVLLPAAATDEKSLLTRLERLESAARGTPAALPQSPPGPPRSRTDDHPERVRGTSPAETRAPEPAGLPVTVSAARPQPAPRERTPDQRAPVRPGPDQPGAASLGPSDVDLLRKNWGAVLEAVRQERRVAWMLLSNASVLSLDDGILTLRFPRDGDLKGFSVSRHDAVLKQVLSAAFGLNVTIQGVVGGDAVPGAAGVRPDRTGAGPGSGRPPSAAPPESVPPGFAGHDHEPPDDRPDQMPADEPSASDRAADPTELSGMDLIQRELGGQVISEIED